MLRGTVTLLITGTPDADKRPLGLHGQAHFRPEGDRQPLMVLLVPKYMEQALAEAAGLKLPIPDKGDTVCRYGTERVLVEVTCEEAGPDLFLTGIEVVTT